MLCGSCRRNIADGGSSCPHCGAPQSIANGRYRILRMLGEGGSKIVYLAHDQMLDRDVAVSLFKVEGLDESGRTRVVREARAMGRLGDHAHIVGIYDIGEAVQGQPYIVSQYVPGGSLSDLLKRSPNRRLPVAEAIRIAEQLCVGIEYAHSLGIIHRDIKPANVFLTGTGAPLLGDFGLAVAPDQSRITSHGMMVGTAAYLPPEQALGHALEPRSDLYSFGAMLYEVLTGRPPFQSDNLAAIVSQHINATADPPSKHAPGIPPALDALVLKVLAKSPAARPLNAATVRETLHTIAASSREDMDQIASTVMVERPNLRGHTAPDGTVSVMFSDIENSTAIMERLGDLRAQDLFRMHNRAIREHLAKYGGYEVKSMGDGFMIAFASARRALLCAIGIQRWMVEHSEAHPDAALKVRIGLNTGEAIREAGDFFGKTVVLAARIGAAARGGEILVSSTFKELTASAGDVRFDSGQDMNLKGLAGAYRVHRALWTSPEKRCLVCGRPMPTGAKECAFCKPAPAAAPPQGSAASPARPKPPPPSPARNNVRGPDPDLRSRRIEAGEFDAMPSIERVEFEPPGSLIETIASKAAKLTGVAIVLAIFALALLMLWRQRSSNIELTMDKSSPPSVQHHAQVQPSVAAALPSKTVPTEPVGTGPVLPSAAKPVVPSPERPSLAEKARALMSKKSATNDRRTAAANLPKSKTIIISNAAPAPHEEEDSVADLPPSAAPMQCAPTPHRYNIQVDAAIDKTTADEMVHRISSLGYRVCEKPVLVNGERQYAVRIGPYNTADEAATAQERLHEQYKAEYSEP